MAAYDGLLIQPLASLELAVAEVLACLEAGNPLAAAGAAARASTCAADLASTGWMPTDPRALARVEALRRAVGRTHGVLEALGRIASESLVDLSHMAARPVYDDPSAAGSRQQATSWQQWQA